MASCKDWNNLSFMELANTWQMLNVTVVIVIITTEKETEAHSWSDLSKIMVGRDKKDSLGQGFIFVSSLGPFNLIYYMSIVFYLAEHSYNYHINFCIVIMYYSNVECVTLLTV